MKKNSVKKEMNREKIGKGNPPKKFQFKPGQSGNPSGRKPIPLEEKQARQFIKDMNAELAHDLIASGKYKALLIQAIETSCQMGKMDGIKFLNDYNGNKPKEFVEVEQVDKYKELTKEEIEVELERRGLNVERFMSAMYDQ